MHVGRHGQAHFRTELPNYWCSGRQRTDSGPIRIEHQSHHKRCISSSRRTRGKEPQPSPCATPFPLSSSFCLRGIAVLRSTEYGIRDTGGRPVLSYSYGCSTGALREDNHIPGWDLTNPGTATPPQHRVPGETPLVPPPRARDGV